MANARNPKRKGHDTSRDQGGFVALPWSVLDCPAYASLSHPARSLLWEFARQFVRDNNGRLLASGAYLAKRGWRSQDVITRAKRELLEAGFIHETVMGHRPNKASWYAVTWRALDKIPGYDVGAAETFERGAYRKNQPIKIASLTPSGGVESAAIGPSGGVGGFLSTPPDGPIRATFAHSSTPSDGDHLDMPSIARGFGDVWAVLGTLTTETKTVIFYHGTYRPLTAKPISLFTSLIPGSRPTDPEVPATPSTGADLSHLTTVRMTDDALDAGTCAASQVAGRTKSMTQAVAVEAGDTYVERDDIYQPNLLEPEEFLA